MIVIGSDTFKNGHSSFTTIEVIIVIIVTPLTMVNHASLKMSMLH